MSNAAQSDNLLNPAVVEDLSAAIRAVKEGHSASDRRMAATYPHGKPTGDGFVVLDYVDEKLACMLEGARSRSLGPLLKPENIIAVREDLFARSVIGTEKYGTPLRVWNGRDSLVDLYQEILDAIMYSGQCRLEKRGDVGGNMLELLINLATQIAGELDKRYQDNGNQTR